MDNEISVFLKISGSNPGWEDHVALSESTCIEWREKFSITPEWKLHPKFGDDSRKLLKQLTPPFYPEDETIIWDPRIDKKESAKIPVISMVVSNQLLLEEGFCFGTDNRMIWGNRSTGELAQLQYCEIRSIEKGQNSLTIFTKNSKTIEILFSPISKLPATSQSENDPSFSPLELLFELFQLIANHNNGASR